jgi:hypothetical protein
VEDIGGFERREYFAVVLYTFVTKSLIEMLQLQGWISELELGYTGVIRNHEQKADITACINEFWRHAKKRGLIV